MSVTNADFNPSGSAEIAAIKAKGLELEKVIKDAALPGRRRSIALTHLETALMFAVKAVVEPDEA